MKKIQVYLLFAFVLISGVLYSQKIDSTYMVCYYKMTFQKDSTNPKSKYEELTVLKIGKESSIFRSYVKEKSDSIIANQVKKVFEKGSSGGIATYDAGAVPQYDFKPEVYRNGNKITVFERVGMDRFAFESQENIKWKLLNEERKISNFICKKAIGKYRNRTIIAWYTNEMNIPEGPYNFKNLPGLIIELQDDKDTIHFTLAGLKKMKLPIEQKMNGIYLTTYEKFKRNREEFAKDPISKLANTRMFKFLSPEDRENMSKSLKSENNHLD